MRAQAVDLACLAVSAAAAVTIWWFGASPLGALGAVLRVWIACGGMALLFGKLWPGRVSVVTIVILAIACEVAFELAYPGLIPSSPEEPGTCYDRQGPYSC